MAKDNMLEETEKKVLVPMIVETLKHKIGESNAVKSTHILGWLQSCGHNVNPGRFRLMINYIRSNDLVVGLVATQKGYYRTDDIDELQRWIDKEMGSIRQKVRPLKRLKLYRMELLNKPSLMTV